jgi:hypothetical protein
MFEIRAKQKRLATIAIHQPLARERGRDFRSLWFYGLAAVSAIARAASGRGIDPQNPLATAEAATLARGGNLRSSDMK